jgi:hypothetical protein
MQLLKASLSAVVALALAAPAMAQDARRPTSGATSSGGTAVSRGGSSGTASPAGSSSNSGGSTMSGGSVRGGSAVSRPSREPRSSARRPSNRSSAGAGAAIPSYSRPRGDRAVRGEAVDRGSNPLPSRGGDYYYPYYPYGYSRWYGYNGYYNRYYGYTPIYTGFGYFYYDPFMAYYDPYHVGAYYGYEDDKDDRDYNIGALRLKVDPKEGEVFVDGLYRGVVDDFDGLFQRLKLEAGAHRLEVRAAGFQPLVFDVLVTPGETTTYRGDLKR